VQAAPRHCMSRQIQQICSVPLPRLASTIPRMENSHVRVLGIGHLAAAVRLQLHHLRLPASHMDCCINSERAALFLACSDFENISSRRALTERARADHSTILFACLRGRTARVGPLITPVTTDSSFAHHLTRSWDFSPEAARRLQTHTPDTRLTHLAQIGATFVIGELAKFLLDPVTKIDAPPYLEISLGQGFPEVDAGTLVASRDDWREAAHLPPRTWHPAMI
jgi:hypothetical protein